MHSRVFPLMPYQSSLYMCRTLSNTFAKIHNNQVYLGRVAGEVLSFSEFFYETMFNGMENSIYFQELAETLPTGGLHRCRNDILLCYTP